jgi:hypothetical protein
MMVQENESAKKADVVFYWRDYENEDKLREAFGDYFTGLSGNNGPFDCNFVRRLEKSVGIIFGCGPSWRYEKGDLVCFVGTKVLKTERIGS